MSSAWPEARFGCTLCGECCRGGQVVRLNGEDIGLLCRFTGLPDQAALVAAGLVEEVFEAPGFPRPRLRFRRKPFAFCPFLENGLDDSGTLLGRCRLHPDFKPLVCHLAPLAREVDDDGSAACEVWSVVAPVEGCPGMGRGGAVEPPSGEIRDRLDREVLWMRERLAQ
jgi:Fe-S-cluster containining protein